MFRPVSMMRIEVVVLARDERDVLRGLGNLGVVQLSRTKSGPDTTPLSPADHTGELAQYDRFLTRIQEIRQSMSILPSTEKDCAIKITLNEVEENLSLMEHEAGELLNKRQLLVQRRKELVSLCEQISCYHGLGIPLDGPDQYSFLHFVTGNLPEQSFEELRKNINVNMVIFPATRQRGRQSLFAITTRQAWSDMEKILQQAGFQREILPSIEGATVDNISEERGKEILQIEEELEQLNSRIRTTAVGFADPLEEIENIVNMEYRLLDASQKFPRTESTVLIKGWVPANDAGLLEQHLREITNNRYIFQSSLPDLSKEEDVPVLLKHSPILRPFEMLVSTYGLPDYRELEPTLFVALSYIIMFGMMFGDAGHGIVLIVCGLVALLAGSSRGIKDAGVLLFSGGLSSMVFGVVYGSYFGIEAFKKYALWHDPIEGDPLQLMYAAIGIGIVLISIGIVLNIINRFRRGDVIGGFLDKFGIVGLLFYWGVLALLTNGEIIRSRGLFNVSIFFFIIVPVVGWSFKEPLEHSVRERSGEHNESGEGLAGAIIESCVGAFEAILSYLANTISFVRLAAYAMSHAALLFAAFMLAEEVRAFPAVGGAFSILIIIAGNLIAIILEGVIASVQALRLEYYEFFSKFFSGRGQAFEPFCLTENRQKRAL